MTSLLQRFKKKKKGKEKGVRFSDGFYVAIRKIGIESYVCCIIQHLPPFVFSFSMYKCSNISSPTNSPSLNKPCLCVVSTLKKKNKNKKIKSRKNIRFTLHYVTHKKANKN